MAQDQKDLDQSPAFETAVAIEDVEEISKKARRKVLLKIDFVVLPLLILTQFLGFLDKNGLAYAALYGMSKEANLKGQEYSWLASIFYFGYLGMEFPTMWILTKVPIGKFIGTTVFFWGMVLCCMAAGKSFATLAVARFFLGIFEAGLLPSFMILNTVWYRREEQPLRTALWSNTLAGVFGGILSYAIGHLHGSLATWKYIFIIYGAITMCVGLSILFILPDSPLSAWFLSASEKEIAYSRTAANQTGVDTQRTFKFGQIRESLADPKYWTMALFSIAQAITNAGITNFNPLIISGYGFSVPKTALMASPQASVAFIAQIIATTLTFFLPNIRCLLWILTSLPALAGAIMIRLLDPMQYRDASLAGVYMMGFYNVPYVLMISLQSSNTAGMTKKSFVSASAAVFYAVGNIIGPQFFRTSQKPHYQLGIGAMICSFAVMAFTGGVYWVVCLYQNAAKNRAAKANAETAAARVDDRGHVDLAVVEQVEVQDVTDVENPLFRYTY